MTAHTPKYASPSRLYTKMDFTFTAATKNSAGASATATVTVTCDIFDELESLLSMGQSSPWTTSCGAFPKVAPTLCWKRAATDTAWA